MSEKKTTEDLLNEFMTKLFSKGYADIISKINGEPKEILELNESIKNLIDEFGKSISYTQLRTIHNELQNAKTLADLANSIHKLVYIEARQEKAKGKAFVRFVRESMEYIIEEKKDVEIKDTFIDTIVAYHKLYV